MNHSEDNAAYEAAKCTKPHSDDTRCMPSWDGYGYVCLTRVVNGEPSEYREFVNYGGYPPA